MQRVRENRSSKGLPRHTLPAQGGNNCHKQLLDSKTCSKQPLCEPVQIRARANFDQIDRVEILDKRVIRNFQFFSLEPN